MNTSIKSAREEQQALEALHRLDEECVHHQRANDYLRAFDCMERALVLRRHFFGLESEEVALACRALAEMCNLLAMSFLQKDNFPVAADLLKKAEVLTAQHGQRFAAERATTLNNLACYYRRLGKLHAAMTSLRSAAAIERRLGRVGNAADTLLNLCAVLSQLGKHDQALAHAQEALLVLQEDVFKPSCADTPSIDRVSVMCIAYHNIGVEQEFLKAYDECVQSYKKGVGLAEQYLGLEHSVTTTVRNSYLAAKRSLSTKPRSTRQKQQQSSDPYAPSPSKAARRLLSSPRDKSGDPSSPTSLLRMPSPLAKEKQRQNMAQIPTPRSIVADALARKSLPPLEAPTGREAGKRSASKAAVAPPLTPTDPFFSPRYSFTDSEARVEPVLAVKAAPERTERASSATRRRSSSGKKTASGERRGNRVKFAETEREGENHESRDENDRAVEVAATEETELYSSSASAISEVAVDGETASNGDLIESVPQCTMNAAVDAEASDESDPATMVSHNHVEMASEALPDAELDEETSATGLEDASSEGLNPPQDAPKPSEIDTQDDTKQELDSEDEQPTEDATGTVLPDDAAVVEPHSWTINAQNRVDSDSVGTEAPADNIHEQDAVATPSASANHEIEDVLDGVAAEVEAEAGLPNITALVSVVGDDGAEEFASNNGGVDASNQAVGVHDTDTAGLVCDLTDSEPPPTVEGVDTDDQREQVAETIDWPVEYSGHEEVGDLHETMSAALADLSDRNVEQQSWDAWSPSQEEGTTADARAFEGHADEEATGEDYTVGDSELQADDTVAGGGNHNWSSVHDESAPTEVDGSIRYPTDEAKDELTAADSIEYLADAENASHNDAWISDQGEGASTKGEGGVDATDGSEAHTEAAVLNEGDFHFEQSEVQLEAEAGDASGQSEDKGEGSGPDPSLYYDEHQQQESDQHLHQSLDGASNEDVFIQGAMSDEAIASDVDSGDYSVETSHNAPGEPDELDPDLQHKDQGGDGSEEAPSLTE